MSTSSSPKKHKDLPLIPETVLRKRHDLDELRRKRAAAVTEEEIATTNKKGFYVKKLETFIALGKGRRNGEIRYKRVRKIAMRKWASDKSIATTKKEEIQFEANATTKYLPFPSRPVRESAVFVIRVRDHHGACAMVKRALSRLRLRRINEGVFVRYDASTRKVLRLVEPYVVYGPPMRSVVKELIERRGFGKVDGRRVALSDNTIIEHALGSKCGVICADDLVHEIYEVGDEFTHVTKFLWPFRLAQKTTHFERETLRFTRGKDYGDKGQEINDFIRQIM